MMNETKETKRTTFFLLGDFGLRQTVSSTHREKTLLDAHPWLPPEAMTEDDSSTNKNKNNKNGNSTKVCIKHCSVRVVGVVAVVGVVSEWCADSNENKKCPINLVYIFLD